MAAAERLITKNADMVYQVRMEKGAGPEDLLDGLTWTVWRVISETRGPALDQHQWPDLRGVLQKILAGRLVRYGRCGQLPQCGEAPGKVFWSAKPGGDPPSEIYILEVKGGVDRLLDGVGLAVQRRFAKALGLGLAKRRAWRADVGGQLRVTLADALYYSPRCRDCLERRGFRERRLWTASPR
jgi:hypothetical protein